MKCKKTYIKHFLFLLVLLVMSGINGFAQGTDMRLERRPGLFLGFTSGLIRSEIINESTLQVEDVNSARGMTFAGLFDFGYKITKSFGIKTGIGYSSSNVQLSLNSYENSLNLKDSENDSYELRVAATSLTETQSMNIVSIPLTLVLDISLSNVVSIFIEPGISFAIPLNSNFTNTGIFTYKGFYPEYNVLLENLPTHGFSNNKTIATEDDLELKKIWSEMFLYSGLDFAVKRNFHIATGVSYSRPISDISDYDSPEDYQLSPAPGEVTSLMGGSSKVTTKSLGFNLTLRYFINR